MPLLIEIGGNQWVVKKEADAAKVMAILVNAVQVEWDYQGKYSDHRNRYYPTPKPDQICLKSISPDQCVTCKQSELPKAPLQLEG